MLLNQTDLDSIVRFFDDPDHLDNKLFIDSFKSTSLEHAKYFLELEKAWLLAQKASRLDTVNTKLASDNLSTSIRFNSIPRNKPNVIKWVSSIAAMFIAIAVGYVLYITSSEDKFIIKSTAKNQIDSLLLKDGSVIILDKNTKISYSENFNKNSREIYLMSGCAFFKIAKDKVHPFKIIIGNSMVQVVGTSFNIKWTDSLIGVNVKTGIVKFLPNKNSDSIKLIAGEGIMYDSKRNSVERKNIQNSDSWLTKELIFKDASLKDVCAELSEKYNIKIVLDGSEHNKKFNAKFKNNDLTDVLQVLKTTYGFTVKIEKEKITLKKTN